MRCNRRSATACQAGHTLKLYDGKHTWGQAYVSGSYVAKVYSDGVLIATGDTIFIDQGALFVPNLFCPVGTGLPFSLKIATGYHQ